ncbi:peptidoglycan-binding protein [Streptomyces sp. NPDC048212]|uniref:peptidoglycan-binding protein n=1 Tax=Streptomyces sp. NPDC048212 TaxID=3156658 RepID=UPI0033F8A7F3
MTTQVTEILAVAAAEVGTQETRSDGHWVNDSKYNKWYGKIPGYGRDGMDYPWCAVYVAWVADKAGLKGLYPKTAGCATAVRWFKDKGRFSEYPAVGAQVFYGSGGSTHTGIVYKYDATYIYTYEGNTNTNGSPEGDGVYAKKWERRASYVYGYGYPEFSEGVLTADPSRKGQEGFTYKTSASAPAKPVEPKPPTKPTKPAAPKPTPKPVSYEPWPGEAYFKKAPRSSLVERMGKRLVQEGCSAYVKSPGPQWTEADRKSYRKWQLKKGYRGTDADGWPGKASWDALKVPKA